MGRPAVDETGKVYNRLTVLRRDGSDENGKAMWLCQCSCGTIRRLNGRSLRRGDYQSCGCLRRKRYDLPYHLKYNSRLKYDLTGKQYGWITVLRYVKSDGKHAVWEAQCRCGNIIQRPADSLRKGSVHSCPDCRADYKSLIYRTDETGNRYGELTVIEPIEVRGGEWYWKCQCDCGEITEVWGSHLRAGTTQRCKACAAQLTAEKNTTHGLTGTPEYTHMQWRRRRELETIYDSEWTIEMELLLKEMFSACVICGSTESLQIDHVRPLSRGYGLKPGNVVILCARCNQTKQAKPLSRLELEIKVPILRAASAFEDAWELNRKVINGAL